MTQDVQSADALSAAGSCKDVDASGSIPSPHVPIPAPSPKPASAVPGLLAFLSVDEYRDFFVLNLCGKPVVTFDGIAVRFNTKDFDHCAFASPNRDGSKSVFCHRRAGRISLIKYALQLATAELYVGWSSKEQRYDQDRRVAIVQNSFVTVIRLTDDKKARFVTSYHCADRSTIPKIRSGPKWPKQ